MSEPSFRLFKRGGKWVASKKYKTRGLVEIPCGDGSQKSAEEIARRAFAQRDQAAEAGRERWRRTRAAQVKSASAPATPPPDPPPPDVEEEVTPIERPALPPPAQPRPADPVPAAAVSPERAEQIRTKLLALGDSRPIEPDSVHAPGEDPRTDDEPRGDGDVEGDNEAGELLAEMIAGAVVIGHVKLVTRRLKNAKPPKQPGEANERMIEWERNGIRYYGAKLFGQSTRLSPFMKMMAGIVGVTVSMYVDSEPLEAAGASTAGAAPSTNQSSAAETPSTAAPSAPAPPPASPAPSGGGGRVLELHNPLGRF